REQRREQLDEEIQSHLKMATRELEERGEPRDEAENAARREFGNVGLVKDVTRDRWGWRWLEDLGQDLRYSLRTMRRSPGFCGVAIITLALGIGANTAIFSLVDAFLWQVLPVRDPQRLVFVRGIKADGRTFGDFPYREFEHLREHNSSFSGM